MPAVCNGDPGDEYLQRGGRCEPPDQVGYNLLPGERIYVKAAGVPV
jgi:hypothetical protein